MRITAGRGLFSDHEKKRLGSSINDTEEMCVLDRDQR